MLGKRLTKLERTIWGGATVSTAAARGRLFPREAGLANLGD
jgi:hypothetical protein